MSWQPQSTESTCPLQLLSTVGELQFTAAGSTAPVQVDHVATPASTN
ncbi:MAG: hypothetical protein Q8N26_00170 [Myxococcales bacterium]|nr:hypothetical protein [Myxococcales bacterium]